MMHLWCAHCSIQWHCHTCVAHCSILWNKATFNARIILTCNAYILGMCTLFCLVTLSHLLLALFHHFVTWLLVMNTLLYFVTLKNLWCAECSIYVMFSALFYSHFKLKVSIFPAKNYHLLCTNRRKTLHQAFASILGSSLEVHHLCYHSVY